MSKDAGDRAYRFGETVQLEYSGTGSEGDVVKWSSGQVTPVTANGDPVVGVIASSTSNASAGDEVSVHVMGAAYVTADGDVTEGDLLQASGSTNGEVVSADSAEGLVTSVDEGATDTYDIYTKYLMALDDASDGDLVPVLLG